jgi:hypothetical protein
VHILERRVVMVMMGMYYTCYGQLTGKLVNQHIDAGLMPGTSMIDYNDSICQLITAIIN